MHTCCLYLPSFPFFSHLPHYLQPRIANMAYETYQLKKAELLQAAGLSPTSSCSSPYSSSQQQLLDRVERAARAYIRDKIFGGRLLFAIVGTAPSSAAVSNLIQEACEMPMVEGYGSTEVKTRKIGREGGRRAADMITFREQAHTDKHHLFVLSSFPPFTARRHHYREPHQRRHGP